MKRKFFVFIIISLFLCTLVSCKSNKGNGMEESQSNKTKTVNVSISGLKGPTSIGMIKMFEDNPNIGENVKAKYEISSSPDKLISKMLNEEIDIAAIPTNVAAKIYNKTGKYKFAAMNTWGIIYIVGNNVDIKNFSDLKGEKIYVGGKGLVPDFTLRYLLKKNNIDAEKDVNLDYTMQNPELAQALISGKVKLAVLPEPFVTQVIQKNKKIKIKMDFKKVWQNTVNRNSDIPIGCLVVKEDFAKQHPQIVDNFLKEYEKSINWVNENKEEAGTLVKKFEILPNSKIAELAIPRCNIKYMNVKDSKETVKEFLKILYDFTPKAVGGKLPDEDFYYKK